MICDPSVTHAWTHRYARRLYRLRKGEEAVFTAEQAALGKRVAEHIAPSVTIKAF